jgi:S1-C subfamily serine protease
VTPRARLAAAAAALALGVAALGLAAPPLRRDPKRLIAATEPGVVLIVVADLEAGQLAARASGSGTVITADGAILTAGHVLDDEARRRAHDLFVVGRFRREGAEPELVCAGLPSAAKRLRAVDLALIACDRDLNGQPWSGPRWPAVPLGRSQTITPGAQIWVLGYGGLGGARMHASAGLVSGWTGEHGGAGRRDYMRTDATVAPGSSGGAAVDEAGNLIGVPSAYRPIVAERAGVTVAAGEVGLIRPIELARDLLAVAQAGFVPTRDDPAAAESAAIVDGAPDAVLLGGRVVDAANRRPITGARVLVARSGSADPFAGAIAVGTTDGDGAFLTDRAVARGGPYQVTILAAGYRTLRADRAFEVRPDAPHVYEPWAPLEMVLDPGRP